MLIDVFMTIRNKKLNGSITVEAAFSFTLTIFILFLMLGPLLIIKTTSDFLIELHETSKIRCNYETLKYASKDSIIYKKVEDFINDNETLADNFENIENAVNYVSLLLDFSNKYGDDKSEYRNIEFIYDMNPEIYSKETNVVEYDYMVDFNLPYNLLNVEGVYNRLVNSRRAFVGSDGNRFDSDFEDGDFVYVANNYVNSSVYHVDINCTYLIKNTREVKYENMSNYRNSSNKKYTKCDYCFKRIELTDDTMCFITEYGDRFHYVNTCPLMTAYVTKIYKENIEAYNLRPCPRCGKLEE